MENKQMPRGITLSEILAMRARVTSPPPITPQTQPSPVSTESEKAETIFAAKPDEFWKDRHIDLPRGKTSVHLRIDSDVLEWFKHDGKGHLTRMNAVLRAYMEAKKK